ncbi:MAG: hypothetical protein WAN35_19595 [Terracidiphilus sp.]
MMKRSKILALTVAAFLLPAFPLTAYAADSKDYPVKVHITASELRSDCYNLGQAVNCPNVQFLTVFIEGKKYTLKHKALVHTLYPIHPGDYSARMTEDEQKSAGQYEREYEILFSDGKTEAYLVVGESE